MHELIRKIGGEPLENLQSIHKQIMQETGAVACCIVSAYAGQRYAPVCGEEGVFRPELLEAAEKTREAAAHGGFVCIPIISAETARGSTGENRREKRGRAAVKGFVFLENAHTPPPEETAHAELCRKYSALIGCNLEMLKTLSIASIDKLTGILGRKYFEKRADAAVGNALSTGRPLCAVLFDLDYFKSVNDTYGHLAGDKILHEVVACAKRCLPPDTIFGRYGGEEFVFLLEDMASARAKKLSETIRRETEKQSFHTPDGHEISVTISMGIAELRHAADLAGLVTLADQALYTAKNTGRNRSVVWDEKSRYESYSERNLQNFITGDGARDDLRITELLSLFDALQRCRAWEELTPALQELMTLLDADRIALFDASGETVRMLLKPEHESTVHDRALITEVRLTGNTVSRVDWENEVTSPDSGLADWFSVCAAPVVSRGERLGVLCLSVSLRKKEFSESEISFIRYAAMLFSAAFRNISEVTECS